MLKYITNCPHCGAHLPEVGVIELRGFRCWPESWGAVGWDAKRVPCDETEGYRCAKCDGALEWHCDHDNEWDQFIG